MVVGYPLVGAFASLQGIKWRGLAGRILSPYQPLTFREWHWRVISYWLIVICWLECLG